MLAAHRDYEERVVPFTTDDGLELNLINVRAWRSRLGGRSSWSTGRGPGQHLPGSGGRHGGRLSGRRRLRRLGGELAGQHRLPTQLLDA